MEPTVVLWQLHKWTTGASLILSTALPHYFSGWFPVWLEQSHFPACSDLSLFWHLQKNFPHSRSSVALVCCSSLPYDCVLSVINTDRCLDNSEFPSKERSTLKKDHFFNFRNVWICNGIQSDTFNWTLVPPTANKCHCSPLPFWGFI